MSKITKSERITQLEQIAVDQARAFKIMADRLNLIEVESKWIIHMTGIETPKLKQLDQSVFDGLDEKWRFAAVDSDGAAFAFVSEPARHGTFWGNSNQSQFTRRSGKDTYDASNWQDSLIERESKELTGSELCKAMLDRGDKWVVCFVAYNEKNIKYFDEPSIVVAHDENGFYVRDSYYNYAVPVNRKGEPLTAAEVGL